MSGGGWARSAPYGLTAKFTWVSETKLIPFG